LQIISIAFFIQLSLFFGCTSKTDWILLHSERFLAFFILSKYLKNMLPHLILKSLWNNLTFKITTEPILGFILLTLFCFITTQFQELSYYNIIVLIIIYLISIKNIKI
jgi:hypothetical protein